MVRGDNPLPLSVGQLRALITAAFREVTWVLPTVTAETRRWQADARRIPDEPLRAAALSSLQTKRGHTDGAAMFSILVPHRDPGLLRLLVAYELIWDYLDSVHESAPSERNGRQLHLALVDAFEASRPLADYYRHHPWRDDGGYLPALVEACRAECRRLPSFPLVRPALIREARRAQVLALNHLTDPAARDAALRRWAADEYPDEQRLEWYELSGAASASLVVHALLAVAADPDGTDTYVSHVYDAYWPWMSLATTMLDSYADMAEDLAAGNHRYLAHYPDSATAIRRIQQAISVSAERAMTLHDGYSHRVILGCMIALYLSKESTRSVDLKSTTSDLIGRAGTLARLLVPILYLWRLRYRHKTA